MQLSGCTESVVPRRHPGARFELQLDFPLGESDINNCHRSCEPKRTIFNRGDHAGDIIEFEEEKGHRLGCNEVEDERSLKGP